MGGGEDSELWGVRVVKQIVQNSWRVVLGILNWGGGGGISFDPFFKMLRGRRENNSEGGGGVIKKRKIDFQIRGRGYLDFGG